MFIKLIVFVFLSLIAFSQSQGVARDFDFAIDPRYSWRSHFVTTPDNYILKLYEIYASEKSPEADNKTVVFVQHAYLSSAADFLVLGPERSLAYMLADAGYDVWLPNSRGNTFSRAHTVYNPDVDPEFWDFEFEDMAIYDLPTSINYALAKSNKTKLHYIGHSQGAKIGYIYSSMVEGANDKIISMHSLAPTAFMGHTISPVFRLPAFLEKLIFLLGPALGFNEIFDHNFPIVEAGRLYCKAGNPIALFLCKTYIYLAFGGLDYKQLQDSDVPKILKEFTAGGSLKNYEHSLQQAKNGRFCRFNNGADYNLTAVTPPVYVQLGLNDWVAVPQDVRNLQGKIPNLFITEVANKNWNHLDFLFGKDANTLVYKPMIENINAYPPV